MIDRGSKSTWNLIRSLKLGNVWFFAKLIYVNKDKKILPNLRFSISCDVKFTNDQDLEKFSSLTHFGFQERRASRQRRREGPGPAVPAGGRPPGPELDQAPVAGRGQRLQQEQRHVQVCKTAASLFLFTSHPFVSLGRKI